MPVSRSCSSGIPASTTPSPDPVTPAGSVAEIEQAYRIGLAYEATLSDRDRRAGAHYTPVDVVEGLVARALPLADLPERPRCWDPSCGGGAFLVAVAEALWRRGIDAAEVVDRCVVGVDLDPGAVAASRRALTAWAEVRGATDVSPTVIEGDGLEMDLGRFDLVIGNPPFRNQLGSATARDEETARRRRDRFGDAALGYVDDAVLFLLEAARSLRQGGVACLVQPRSTLSVQHAAVARAEVQADGRHLVAAWLPGVQVFDAVVEVWAPFVRSGGQPADVMVFGGRTAELDGARSHPVVGGDWSPIAATADGVPELGDLRLDGGVADRAVATAGFRDEYYALLAHTVDEEPDSCGMRLVTTGMIDPGVCRWGEAPARFGKRAWDHPWLDVAALEVADPRIARWVERLAVPKVLVASQTRVVEAVADPVGDLVPVTPTIAVVPADSGDLGLLVAALVSPPVAALLRRRRAGSGMSATTVRVTAKDLLDVPLPADRVRWAAAAAALSRGATWAEHGSAMCSAYGADDPAVLAWWLDALPKRARRPAPVSD